MKDWKVVHEIFTTEEHEQLRKAKGQKNWHDFIMTLTRREDE